MCFLSLVINSLLYSHISINGYKNTQHHSLHISYQHHGPGVHKTIKSAFTVCADLKYSHKACLCRHYGVRTLGLLWPWTMDMTSDQREPPMRQQRHKQFGSKSTSSGEYQYIMSIQRSAGSRALIQCELLTAACVHRQCLTWLWWCPLLSSAGESALRWGT